MKEIIKINEVRKILLKKNVRGKEGKYDSEININR